MAKQKKTEEQINGIPFGVKMEILDKLAGDIHKTHHQTTLTFDEFLFLAGRKPKMIFRDIFQLYHDMVHHYVPEGFDEYPVTGDSAGFLNYDMNKLFVENCNDPFYADRIFANRFMSLADSFRKGVQNNQIYFFEGPPGSGKSTFLNILLKKMEDYTHLPDGAVYKLAWELNLPDLPGYNIPADLTEKVAEKTEEEHKLLISCPNNDHPITIFPKELRAKLLSGIIVDRGFLKELLSNIEYKWIFTEKACTFCTSMYHHLVDIYKNPVEVFRMVRARRMEFNRHMGKGISVYNPGDPLMAKPVENRELQQNLNRLFSTDEIPHIHSRLAFTNNGIYALMDIKDQNINRLINLHGIVSDGVHKVDYLEESIRSLFLGVINPEDKVTYENVQSFRDRIVTIKIPYVLDYNTEVNIWKHKFGLQPTEAFMPRVLSNLSKIIISSRMLLDTSIYDEWLKIPEKYKSYIDDNLLLLKMELYTGKIPRWLDDDDVKNFKKEVRKKIILETELEGTSGISGRQSLKIFARFITRNELRPQSISMSSVIDFVKNDPILSKAVPQGFPDAIFNLYEFNILDEVKDSIYFYNVAKIKRDLKNYLFALNFEPGETITSHYTGDRLLLNNEFYNSIEPFIFGDSIDHDKLLILRKQEHLTYITQTLSAEIKLRDIPIEQTEQFISMHRKYEDNLKKSALAPFDNNDHFKRCIQSFNTPAFNKFESPLKRTVNRIIDNLVKKFGYTEQSAQYIVLYVIENKLNERFRNFGID
jgi:predicted Ser/Thr protein kinase